MSALFSVLYETAMRQQCIRCGRMHTRLGEQAGRLVVDVLCHDCFENAPSQFKLTPAQDVYRDAVKSGCHPRIAQRRAEVAGGFSWGDP